MTAGMPKTAGVSTHVLDAATGRPAVGMAVVLEARPEDQGRAGEGQAGGWQAVGHGETDDDGRVPGLAPAIGAGVYRLRFDVEGYLGEDAFYPEVTITFRVTPAATHLHVPLLLSPFAYSTYRGS